MLNCEIQGAGFLTNKATPVKSKLTYPKIQSNEKLIAYMRSKQDDASYKEIKTPEILDRSLWDKSGHWEKFGANMYTSTTPD